jgi:hypothetical protein
MRETAITVFGLAPPAFHSRIGRPVNRARDSRRRQWVERWDKVELVVISVGAVAIGVMLWFFLA